MMIESLDSKRTYLEFIVIGLIFVIILSYLTIPVVVEKRRERHYLQSLRDPEYITIEYNGKETVLDKGTSSKFLKELQSKSLGYRNTSYSIEYVINIKMTFNNLEVDQYYFAPDSHYYGQYWIMSKKTKVPDVKRFSSIWLMIFLKEHNFYDHNKIIKK